MIKILGIYKSGYYDWLKRKPSKSSIYRAKVKEAIQEKYDESHSIYGAPKITVELHKRGFNTAERTITKYMRGMGIRACWVKPYTVTTHSEDFSNRLKNMLKRTSYRNCQMLYGVQTLHIFIQRKALFVSA